MVVFFLISTPLTTCTDTVFTFLVGQKMIEIKLNRPFFLLAKKITVLGMNNKAKSTLTKVKRI